MNPGTSVSDKSNTRSIPLLFSPCRLGSLCVLLAASFCMSALVVAQESSNSATRSDFGGESTYLSTTGVTERQKADLVTLRPRKTEALLVSCNGDPTQLMFPLDGSFQLVNFCGDGPSGAGPAQCTGSPPDQHNDDDSATVALGFVFDLFGDQYTRAYVNNNGNISFGTFFSRFTAVGFPSRDFPMVAPFWADVDTGSPSNPIGNVWFKQFDSDGSGSADTLVVIWANVGYYDEHTDLRNTFEVAISDGSNSDMGLGRNVCFSWANMCWTTGDASDGDAGFRGTSATVGINRGDGFNYYQIGRFDHEGSDYAGSFGVSGVSYLDSRRTCFTMRVPQVISRSPGTDSTDAPRDVVVQVVFDGDLQPASVNSHSVSLQLGGQGVPYANVVPSIVGYDAARRAVRLVPLTPLRLGATYTVVLSSLIRSSNSVPINATSWSFRTASSPQGDVINAVNDFLDEAGTTLKAHESMAAQNIEIGLRALWGVFWFDVVRAVSEITTSAALGTAVPLSGPGARVSNEFRSTYARYLKPALGAKNVLSAHDKGVRLVKAASSRAETINNLGFRNGAYLGRSPDVDEVRVALDDNLYIDDLESEEQPTYRGVFAVLQKFEHLRAETIANLPAIIDPGAAAAATQLLAARQTKLVEARSREVQLNVGHQSQTSSRLVSVSLGQTTTVGPQLSKSLEYLSDEIDRKVVVSFLKAGAALVKVGAAAGIVFSGGASSVAVVWADAVIWGASAGELLAGFIEDGLNSLTPKESVAHAVHLSAFMLAEDAMFQVFFAEATLQSAVYLANGHGQLASAGAGRGEADVTPSVVFASDPIVPDVFLDQSPFATAEVVVRNQATDQRSILLVATVLTQQITGESNILGFAGPGTVKLLEPDEEHTIVFNYSAPRSIIFGREGYVLRIEADVIDHVTGAVEHMGPIERRFRVGTSSELAALDGIVESPIAEGILDLGAEESRWIQIPAGLQAVQFRLSHGPGVVMDLHLYDPFGNHIGHDYESDESEVLVPGGAYSGLGSYPQVVRIEEPSEGVYRIRTVARIGGGRFVLIQTGIPPMPAVLTISNDAPRLVARRGIVGETTLAVIEAGHTQAIGALRASATHLSSKSGGFIPATRVTIRNVQSSLDPGAAANISVSVDVPLAISVGTYFGALQFVGSDEGSGRAVSAVALLTVIVPRDGDTDYDGDADALDASTIFDDSAVCFGGPGMTYVASVCKNGDLDEDNDIDLADFGAFQLLVGRLCSVDAQCDDGKVCTQDTCQNGSCKFTELGSNAAAASDCNGNNVPDECEMDAPEYCLVVAVDRCEQAMPITSGVLYTADTSGVPSDGAASCGASAGAPDVWFRYTPAISGVATFSLCAGADYDSVISVHSGCPGGEWNQLACNDDNCGLRSKVTAQVSAGQAYAIRIAGYGGAEGRSLLRVFGPPSAAAAGDCNHNAIFDVCDISSGTSLDCNANLVPDECEVACGRGDCNANGSPDSCDVATGVATDWNRNGIPDDCETVVHIQSPNGGESWLAGSSQLVTWESTNPAGSVDVSLIREGGSDVEYIGTAPMEAGQLAFQVCQFLENGADYRVHIEGCNGETCTEDESDASFSIMGAVAPPDITITSPTASSIWEAGTTQVISWTGTSLEGYVEVSVLSEAGDGFWIDFVPVASGSLPWIIWRYIGDGSNYRIRLRMSRGCGPPVEALSEPFEIIGSPPRPILTLATPNGAEVVQAGSAEIITWTSTNPAGDVSLWLTKGGAWVADLGSAAMADGQLPWPVCPYMQNGLDFRVHVEWCDWPICVSDDSDGEFAIAGSIPAPTITIASPTAGTQWQECAPATITWQSTEPVGRLEVYLQKESCSCGIYLGSVPVEGSSFRWDTVEPFEGLGADYYVELLWLVDGCPPITAESDVFSIAAAAAPQIEFTTPTAETAWEAGTIQTITWTSSRTDGYVEVSLLAGQDESYFIGSAAAIEGAIAWNIWPYIGDGVDYRVQLLWWPDCGPSVELVSVPFEIRGSRPRPTLTLTQPNGGESFPAGSTQLITWDATNAAGDVWMWLEAGGEWVADIGPAPMAGKQASWVACPHSELGSNYRVVIQWCDWPICVTDMSDAVFEITGSVPVAVIAVTSPAGGTVWRAGTTQMISWNSDVQEGYVDVSLYRGSEWWQWIGQAPASDQSLGWPICPTIGDATDYTVHLWWWSSCGTASTEAVSNLFEITGSAPQPIITVESPNGGEVWGAGTEHVIEWQPAGQVGSVDLWLIRRDAENESWDWIGTAPMADGRFIWNCCDPASVNGTNYWIRIEACCGPCVGDESDAPFEIAGLP